MSLYGGMDRTGTMAPVLCDLRSDTVTTPDRGMRQAIAEASVGDDVYGDDPTVNLLEARIAALTGKEAAAFFPTGTQSNLSAVLSHCERGDEVLVGRPYHIYCDEAAGVSVLGGVAMTPVETEASGCIPADEVERHIHPDDPHYPHTRLLCLENTVSGQVIAPEVLARPARAARALGLAVHLDGARLFNAAVASNSDLTDFTREVDTVSLCMSKGIGAPAGTVLAGSADLIARSRRLRKLLGGAMRQSGVLAAACLHGLENVRETLSRDHKNAAMFAESLRKFGWGTVRHQSNMVFFEPPDGHLEDLVTHLATCGVLVGAQHPAFRMVFHRGLTDNGIEAALNSFDQYMARL